MLTTVRSQKVPQMLNAWRGRDIGNLTVVVEHPAAGEVIYVNRQSNRVLCRRWNWRNADFSKITPETRTVVLNVDGMTSGVPREEIEEATETLARMILRFCQGVVSTHYLDRDRPEAEILSSAV